MNDVLLVCVVEPFCYISNDVDAAGKLEAFFRSEYRTQILAFDERHDDEGAGGFGDDIVKGGFIDSVSDVRWSKNNQPTGDVCPTIQGSFEGNKER